MKRYLFAAVLSVASCDQAMFAQAADMPVKAAPKFVTAYQYGGSGVYCFGGTHGESQKIDVVAPAGAPASVFAAGGSVDGGCGYTYTLSPTRWLAFEGFVSYANTGANQGGVTFATKVSGTQRLLYGGDLSMLTQWLPNLSTILPVLPEIPVGSNNPLAHPYVAAVLRESNNEANILGVTDKKLRVTYGLGAGVITQLSNGSALDTWVDATSSSGAHLNQGVGIVERAGVTYRAGASYKFGVSRN